MAKVLYNLTKATLLNPLVTVCVSVYELFCYLCLCLRLFRQLCFCLRFVLLFVSLFTVCFASYVSVYGLFRQLCLCLQFVSVVVSPCTVCFASCVPVDGLFR